MPRLLAAIEIGVMCSHVPVEPEQLRYLIVDADARVLVSHAGRWVQHSCPLVLPTMRLFETVPPTFTRCHTSRELQCGQAIQVEHCVQVARC